jgi:hypothetical protein
MESVWPWVVNRIRRNKTRHDKALRNAAESCGWKWKEETCWAIPKGYTSRHFWTAFANTAKCVSISNNPTIEEKRAYDMCKAMDMDIELTAETGMPIR